MFYEELVMTKKKVLVSSIGLFLLLLVAAFVYLWQPPTSYAFRQVKKIAPQQANFQLVIDKHIRFTARPEESFDFPIALGEIGPVNSLYSGPGQYPFYCMTLNSGLGQPEVDNQEGYGVPVYASLDDRKTVIGFSKDCGVRTRLSYYQLDSTGEFSQLSDKQLSDANTLETRLFRVEQGTINRFIYTLVMPISADEIGDRLASSWWNKRLIYQFQGGSGIGYRQGRQLPIRVMDRQKQQLLDGYAVISSSGNRTSYTYNMLLAEDTARRVKKQFTALYGAPLYTVGIGGSGGGLAQYLIGQNSSGILDGLIPLYSYPDMITQTTYALDCDLLNNYFTFRAENRASWNDWQRRRLIEGMNAINDFPQKTAYLQPVNQIMAGFVPSLPKGNSECINGYFGLSTFINNPRQGFIRDFFHPDVVEQVNWSYWQDMAHILGQDENGFGLSTWDNVGVQYGLSAFVAGDISIDEFLDINRKIGSWKPQQEMQAEEILTPFGRKIPLWLSLWGNQNITELKDRVAPRHRGAIAAMNAAYRSGQVFIGDVELPIIDVRHYLEDDLDMHHVSASFYSRLRIEQARGHAENHVIWIAHKDHNPVKRAFQLMDEWLLTAQTQIDPELIKAKPSVLQDTCFAADGSVIAQGQGVWDGDWNKKTVGTCQQAYPMYSTSRIQAGGQWAGDVFKCRLIPVTQAIAQGLYGAHQVLPYQQRLEQIFPEGVCDYSAGDLGRPDDI